jgi:hypothetical protein
MWRYFVGVGAVLLLAVAGVFLFRGSASVQPALAATPPAARAGEDAALPDEAPSASAKTREQKRFDRIDKDKNDTITRDEFFVLRRKAFAKLDTNGDGRLSFEEWAIRGTTRFAAADKDRSGTLNRTEFATTAVKRKAPAARCACPKPAAKAAPAAAEEGDGEE